MEKLSQLWSILTAFDLLGIAAAVIVIATVFETVFGVEVIGRRIFRLIGRVLMFFVKWLFTPALPYWKSCQKFLSLGERIEGQLKEMGESLEYVKNECTLNGGKSLKDTVNRLDRHDDGNWKILTEVREALHLIGMRLDITDEADKRMPFRLDKSLECTMISSAFLRFFGWTEQDILGSDWDFCITEDTRQEVLARWKRSLDKHVPYRNDNQWILDSDGHKYKCLVRGYPYNDFDGNFAGFYGTVEVLNT